MKPVSVLIVDDDPFFRGGLQRELSRVSGIVVLTGSGNLDEALATVGSPDIVLLDLGLPGSCKRLAIGDVLSRWPSSAVLVITAYASGTDVVLAFAEGARGYLAKSVGLTELINAIHAVAAGGTYVTPTLAGALLGAGIDLTAAERAVLRCIAQGMPDKRVALTLSISPRAVENRLASVRQKAGLLDGSRAALTRFAMEADAWCQLSDEEHAEEDGRRRASRQRRLVARRARRRRLPPKRTDDVGDTARA
ncbi:MAG: response regulator transcription factor [Acidimicrobiales bacterium]